MLYNRNKLKVLKSSIIRRIITEAINSGSPIYQRNCRPSVFKQRCIKQKIKSPNPSMNNVRSIFLKKLCCVRPLTRYHPILISRCLIFSHADCKRHIQRAQAFTTGESSGAANNRFRQRGVVQCVE